MFKAVQKFDCAGNVLDKFIIRTVYAVDRTTDCLLIEDFTGQFSWIPMWTCVPYHVEYREVTTHD